MAIATKNALIKAYQLIEIVEKYHTVLQKTYKLIANNL